MFRANQVWSLALIAAGLCTLATTAHADLSISNQPTQNMSCDAGVCTATAPDAVLNVDDLANMLAAGDTKVVTGGGAVNIDVTSALSWSSTSRLSLDANSGLTVQALVTVAGSGALTLTYNDGSGNGDLIFSSGGNVRFANLTSSLSINGTKYLLVGNLADLASRVHKKSLGAFALANDYDASVDGTYTKAPIKEFNGTFEGLGHAISNLTIADSHKGDVCLGLFSFNSGLTRDLGLRAATVTSPTAVGLGILVGCGAPKLARVSVDGTAEGSKGGFYGGVVGHFESPGSAYFVTSAADVTSTGLSSFVGGVAGSSSGAIIHSRATGHISGGDYSGIGGLLGEIEPGGQVSFCSASGPVADTEGGRGAYLGGLVGYSSGPITQSFATGPVSGYGVVGGLVGAGTHLDNSYATGAATGQTGPVGGLVGIGASIADSYSTGLVTLGQNPASKPFIGGFVGQSGGRLKRGYWDTDTAGTQVGCGKDKRCRAVTGLTDAQLKSGLPTGFDPKIWGSDPKINDGYPYLLANPPR